MRRPFVTLDVFTNRRFAGNPLAVVLDARGLDGPAMQAVAREFNLSETVFVLPPDDRAHRAKLRIFTPAAELAFAGHPTIGTAALLAQIDGGSGSRALVLEEGIGPVRCTAEPIDAEIGRARFVVPKLPEETGPAPDDATIAAGLGIDVTDIGGAGLEPERWSAGFPLLFVPVRGLDAIRRCRVDPAPWGALFGPDPKRAAFIFCAETAAPGNDFHARMFAPDLGVAEDPATGSAAAALAGLLARALRLRDGDHDFRIEQGHEMGRPSLIELSLAMADGRLASAAIAGEAVMAMDGAIEA